MRKPESYASVWDAIADTPDGVQPEAQRYLSGEDPRSPLASPLYADLSHFPPPLIHVGKDEVLLDDSRRLADRARAAGVAVDLKIWPVVPHAWQITFPTVPEARQSIHEASAFLHAALPSQQAAGARA
jgi:acetyl esterase/lipase